MPFVHGPNGPVRRLGGAPEQADPTGGLPGPISGVPGVFGGLRVDAGSGDRGPSLVPSLGDHVGRRLRRSRRQVGGDGVVLLASPVPPPAGLIGNRPVSSGCRRTSVSWRRCLPRTTGNPGTSGRTEPAPLPRCRSTPGDRREPWTRTE